uniref:Uncharacterized protein n=1 Tax=Romanomermis culicivorax TaxID=13658 RepID=A0A915JVV1_ROMCU
MIIFAVWRFIGETSLNNRNKYQSLSVAPRQIQKLVSVMQKPASLIFRFVVIRDARRSTVPIKPKNNNRRTTSNTKPFLPEKLLSPLHHRKSSLDDVVC